MSQLHSFSTIIHDHVPADLLGRWKELWENSENGNLFNSPQWFDISSQNIQDANIHILEISQQGETQAILPLVKTQLFGITVFATLNPSLSDTSTLLLKSVDEQLLHYLAQQLQQFDGVALHETPQEYANAINGRNVKRIKTSICPYISLPEAVPALSSKSFKKIRTRMNNKSANLAFSVIDPKETEILSVMSEVEKSSPKFEWAQDVLQDEEVRSTYQKLLVEFSENTYIGVLRDGDKTVITDFGIIAKDTLHSLHTAYRLEYSDYWPGNVLQFKIIQSLENHPAVKIINLGRGMNSLKNKFATGSVDQFLILAHQSKIKLKYLTLMIQSKSLLYKLKDEIKLLSLLALGLRKIRRIRAKEQN